MVFSALFLLQVYFIFFRRIFLRARRERKPIPKLALPAVSVFRVFAVLMEIYVAIRVNAATALALRLTLGNAWIRARKGIRFGPAADRTAYVLTVFGKPGPEAQVVPLGFAPADQLAAATFAAGR